MASPGNELVRRPHIFAGSLIEVEKELELARRRGLLHGEQYTVARLKDGRYAVKVWIVGHHDPVKPKRWPLTPGQTLALSCCLGALSCCLGALAFLAVVVWMIVQAVTAVGHAIVHNVGPIIGALIVLGLLILFTGGGGGGTFSGTFKGSWR